LTGISLANTYYTYVEVVPSLGYLSSAIVGGASTSSSLIVSGTAAADVGQSTVTLGKSILELANRVGGSVARLDASLVQPAPGRETAVVENGSLEELDNLFVFSIFRAIARHVECGEASSVLAELMLVKLVVGSALVDPVLVHPCDEVIFAKRLDQAQDAGTLVWRDDGTVGQRVGGVG
jgi:hypothetical protein